MQTWLVFFPAFYSFFYGGTMGTYLSLHFSVRARALSSLIVRKYRMYLVCWTELLTLSHSHDRHPSRHSLWPTPGHETLVSGPTGLGCIPILASPTDCLLHLDWHRVREVWTDERSSGLRERT